MKTEDKELLKLLMEIFKKDGADAVTEKISALIDDLKEV